MECTIHWQPTSGMAFMAETGSGHVINMDGAPDGGGDLSGGRLAVEGCVGDRHPELDGAANGVGNSATLRHGSCWCPDGCVGTFILTPQDPPTSPDSPPTPRQ